MATNQKDLDMFDQFVASQKTTGDLIEGIIRNVKKDSASRKTVQYYEERLRRLDMAWSDFETTDSKIRCLENQSTDHKYFTEKYYDKISELTFKYRDNFETAMMETSNGPAAETNQHHAADKKTGNNTNTTAPLSSTNSTIRRQNVMMESLKRLLIMDPTAANMNLKEKLWEQIQNLHFSIWEGSPDPLGEGYDMDSYTNLEKLIIDNFKLSPNIAPERRPQSEQNNVLPLPKVTIPQFNGDYLQWRTFFDLFSQLVDKQRIPTVQKMWYLKSNVAGEAGKLISHLSATADNYDTAWKMLQERYNNQRVLVATIIQQLLDQPSGGSSAAAIKQLHDITQECLHALQNIGVNTTTWDPILLHLLVKKLDRGIHVLYERSITNPKELPQIKHFLTFLETRFQSMEAMGQKEKSFAKVCATTASSNQNENACTLCKNGTHPLFRCQHFQQLTPPERLNFAQKQKLCVNCLKSGHSAKNCTSRSCTKCNKKHNSMLHLESAQISSNQAPSNVKNNRNNFKGISSVATSAKDTPDTTPSRSCSPNDSAATSLAAANKQSSNSYVLLSTAVVKVKGEHTEVECRALLDSGSQVNFVTERLVKRLGIPMQPSSVNINGIGATNTRTQHRINVALHSRINGFSTPLEAFVLPRIISPQPSQFINTDNWSLPKNLVLADPTFNRPDKIDILLGAEHYHQLLSIGQIKLSEQLPLLQNTVFGWVVSGKIQAEHRTNVACGVCTADEGLEASIARLWELDEIKTNEKSLSMAERQCEQHFTQHTFKNHENRFVVKIPFHQSPTALGDSYRVALNRFFSLERRLQKNPETRTKYIKFMDEYESMGHMTKISSDAIPSPNYFIPHHCVLRPESSTTKLRVVFDASAKTTSGHSLNDLMYTGPTVQCDLFSILLRFRFPKFVFTTDVEKMYRQVVISPEDRQFQLIIWRKDANKPITYYQLNTVTYGTRAAPYLATKCLQKLAEENTVRYPLAAKFLLENFYVDDGLGGADSLVTTLQLQEQLTQIMKESGFNLRKWCANHPQLLRNIPQGDLEVNLDFENTKADSIKTLGLTWLPKDDKLCVKVNVEAIKRITKRSVTSDLARLFDPLGILSPIIVAAKILIQNLWELKLDWDQSLPEELHTKWLTFRSDLEVLKTLQISRHIFQGGVPEVTQLHIFTDASEKAYGAAAYIRSVFKNGTIIVRLLCAKSRVAPLKKQTIPRLELCAAVLGAQLAAKITADLQFTNPIWFWTDSEIVLSWIHSSSALYNTFVANRISIIQETTRAEQWRHVSSKNNPADILSRGISPKALKDCTLWFYGPLFLHGQETVWPPRFIPGSSTNNNLERKRKAPLSLIVATAEPDFIYKINHKNSFHRLQRIVGYVLRFINHTRRKRELREAQISLTTTELDLSLIPIIKQVQASEFKEDIQQLKRYNELRGACSLSNLSPFLDKNGLIRVGGRLDASSLAYDSMHQFLIPYNDPISKLIFEMVHKENKHCGAQTLLGIIRQRYWPIKGKLMARATIHRCTICSRAKPVLFNQIMGNLPSTRVTPARPFLNAGIDYCGPITVHYKLRGKRPHKAYIAVFCCFATKAVHLELVSDLTTEAFIGALKRFIGRRGHCQNLYCDNATNFIGAKNQLPELTTIIHSSDAHEAITNACNKKGIQFNFIPPRAPHFGGLWEAAVKSAKHLLVRSLGNSSLTYEELETLIIEIEAILNSRPISPMSNDPNDIAALTPGHFLIGEPLTAQIDAQAQPTKTSLQTRWKLVSHLKHEFWNRWSRDYLNELQYRNKWQERAKNLKEGDIVIIKEDNVPVMKWPIGRILKIYKGKDEIVRVADVKTASSVFKRAIQYLAPLPKLNDEKEEGQQQSIQQATTSTDNVESHSFTPSSDEMSKIKKRRMSALPSMPILLIALLAFPLIFAAKVEITEFESNVGIHFEGIGNTRVSRSEWNIITYYELQPYWREMATFAKGTTALQHVCDLINQKTTCINALRTFEVGLADLTAENTLLKDKRVRRGAINLVGNIANSLFGVLDSHYAEHMSNTINAINKDETHLHQLLRNQTSIIDATLNVFKQEESEIKEKFDALDAQLTEIVSRIHEVEQEIHQGKLFQIFISLSVQLSMISARLHRIQTTILTTLYDSHHGKISPKLLSPSQLQNELVRIRNHLPASLQLPVDRDNLLQLYKIMNVKGGITNEHVIFHVIIPLCDPEGFETFKAHPIPTAINNTIVTIQPCSDIIAVTAHRDQYVVITEKQWESCITIKEEEFLCPNIQAKFNADSDRCLCEISLLNNNSHSKCNILPTLDNPSLTQLEHKNHWMFTMMKPTRINAVCGQEHSQITLKGSGLLKISPDCTLKHKSIVIQGHQTYTSSLQSSYTAIANISSIVYPAETQLILDTFHIKNYTEHLKNITAIQHQLHQQVLTDLPSQLQHIKYHHATIAYAALILVIGVIVIMIYKRPQRQTMQLNQQRPCPAARQHTTPTDYVVTVT